MVFSECLSTHINLIRGLKTFKRWVTSWRPYNVPRLYPMESMNVQYWYTECWRPLVLMVVGDVNPHQDTGASHLLTLTGWKLDHQPSLPPGLKVKPGGQSVQIKCLKSFVSRQNPPLSFTQKILERWRELYLIFAKRMKWRILFKSIGLLVLAGQNRVFVCLSDLNYFQIKQL